MVLQKWIVLVLAVLLLMSNAMPEQKKKNELAFDILKFLGSGLHLADSGISFNALHNLEGYGEHNPLVGWTSKNPALWLGQTAGLMKAKDFATQKVYDTNKTAGYIMAALLAAISAAAVYSNLKTIAKNK